MRRARASAGADAGTKDDALAARADAIAGAARTVQALATCMAFVLHNEDFAAAGTADTRLYIPDSGSLGLVAECAARLAGDIYDLAHDARPHRPAWPRAAS